MVRYKIYAGFGYVGKMSNKTVAHGFGSIKTARAACYKMIWNQGAHGSTYYMVYDDKNRTAGVAYQSHKGLRGSFWVDPDGKCYHIYADGSLSNELK